MALWSLLNNNVFDNAVYQSSLKQKLQTVHYNINFNTLGQLDQAHWATVGFVLPIELPRDTITSVQSVARCMSSYTIQIKSMTRFTKFTWLPNHIPITNITDSIFIKYYLQFFFIVLVINNEVSKSVNIVISYVNVKYLMKLMNLSFSLYTLYTYRCAVNF